MSRATDRLVAGTVATVGAGTLVVTTYVAYRSWSAFAELPSHLTAPTQAEALWTGLLAANLMLLQVVLLARLPWLERGWGRGTLTVLHAVLGFASFWLMLLHVALFALQRTERRPGDAGGALLDLFVHDRHMLIATIGTVLVVAVTLTSSRALRRRIRYELWHLLHLWSYVAIGLVLPHELVSADFVGTWTTTYWWALHLVPLALVLAFRVALPLARSTRHRLTVVDRVPETPGVTSLVVAGRDLDRLGVRSGQFLLWRFGGPGRTRGHPYSISSAPTADTLRVTIGGVGDGARAAADTRIGARVLVEGPYGALAPLRRRHPHLLLVAAGMGITPFRALLEDTPLRPGEATLIQRARSAEDLLFAEEIDELAARRGFAVVRLLGPRRAAYSFLPAGHEGSPDSALRELAPDLLTSDVYVCGPPQWTWGVTRAARAAGVHRRDLHREDFGW